MSDETSPLGPQRFADPSRGTNQVGVRLYNERLILSLVRRHGALPKADIARLTGLSPQTTTVIMNRLEAEGLLIRQAKQRGKVGQPAVPYAPNPDGVFSLGLKIGRRSSDIVLLDFVGTMRDRRRLVHHFPEPGEIRAWIAESLRAMVGAADGPVASRMSGMGVAIPFELWNWPAEAGAPQEAVDAWRCFDVKAELQALMPWPVQLCNDATAACAAELVAGKGRFRDFLYVFCGSFIGGGLVLDHALFPGRRGNAGAVGSMPVASVLPGGGTGLAQLIHAASVIPLEQELIARGVDASGIWGGQDGNREAWHQFGEPLERWIAAASAGIAQAAVAATAVIDFNAVVIDGVFPAGIRTRLVDAVRENVARIDRRGLLPAEIAEGLVGPLARSMGAGMLPILARFARDMDVLFKEAAE
jgi:predicted NBD/HSP70 family sugar kinase